MIDDISLPALPPKKAILDACGLHPVRILWKNGIVNQVLTDTSLMKVNTEFFHYLHNYVVHNTYL